MSGDVRRTAKTDFTVCILSVDRLKIDGCLQKKHNNNKKVKGNPLNLEGYSFFRFTNQLIEILFLLFLRIERWFVLTLYPTVLQKRHIPGTPLKGETGRPIGSLSEGRNERLFLVLKII